MLTSFLYHDALKMAHVCGHQYKVIELCTCENMKIILKYVNSSPGTHVVNVCYL